MNRIKYLLVKNDRLWFFIRPFVIFFGKLQDARSHQKYLEKIKLIQEKEEIKNIIQNLKVVNGPFKDMIYPAFEASGSGIFPKLIGSYECEIHSQLLVLLETPYTTIIDIGCAEGYYAVGLALQNANATVYAYDANPIAQNQCKKMAIINGVSERVMINGMFNTEALKSLDLKGRSLVICDCEGFEKQIFTRENVKLLSNADLIIETHDVIELGIADQLRSVLSESHNITTVGSISNEKKTSTYKYLSGQYALEELYYLYEERPFYMEWLICTAKKY